jgi:hypothetical protein
LPIVWICDTAYPYFLWKTVVMCTMQSTFRNTYSNTVIIRILSYSLYNSLPFLMSHSLHYKFDRLIDNHLYGCKLKFNSQVYTTRKKAYEMSIWRSILIYEAADSRSDIRSHNRSKETCQDCFQVKSKVLPKVSENMFTISSSMPCTSLGITFWKSTIAILLIFLFL